MMHISYSPYFQKNYKFLPLFLLNLRVFAENIKVHGLYLSAYFYLKCLFGAVQICNGHILLVALLGCSLLFWLGYF